MFHRFVAPDASPDTPEPAATGQAAEPFAGPGDIDDGAYAQDRLSDRRERSRRRLTEDGALVYIHGRREGTREVEATISAILAKGARPTNAQYRIRVDAFDRSAGPFQEFRP